MARRSNPSTSSATKGRRGRKKAEPSSRGLSAKEVASGASEQASELAREVVEDGGMALAIYREPFGGHSMVFASLPVDKVEATPYQRDISETHVKRLASAIERVGRYVDPIVAVRHDGRYWTPNGGHRLSAARQLGARSIMALVLPEPDVAYQILALNTEKSHNLRERSLEVIRMYRGLVGAREGKETDFAALFEEPALVTLGAAYEKRPRYSAGAYHPVVKRIETFFDEKLEKALAIREKRADRLLELDDLVVRAVDSLKAQGLESPYLKNFVVARINPMRFQRGATAEFDPTVDKMMAAAGRFEAAKVRREDLARMGGGGVEADAE